MNKTISVFICAMLIALASCGSSISDKIKDSKALSAADYSEMVDYMYEAMCDMEQINRTADPYDQESLMASIHEVTQEYPLVPLYYTACMKAVNSDSENFNKNTVNMQKFGRVVDCMARGWGKFW
ncbi:MAG: hypothetical protein J1F43_04240 [Muribaculaceae bacterium]|nr:hypothetical protein [Muribaculaceae bacterium]